MGLISQTNSRNLDRGKSFRFSEYNSWATYKNDDYVQDFVLYEEALWACVSNEPVWQIPPAKNSPYWTFLISGIEGKSPKFVFENDKLYYYYEDKTQLLGGFDVKGDKGDNLRFEDLTDAQKAELKGEPGKDGLNGANGKDGHDGNDGRNGRDGNDGKDGKDGKNGSTYIPSVNNSTVTWTLTNNDTLPDRIQMALIKGEDAYDYYRRLELEDGNTPLSKKDWLRSQFTEIQKIWIDNIDDDGNKSEDHFLHVLTNSCCYHSLITPIEVVVPPPVNLFRDIIYQGGDINSLFKETEPESTSYDLLCALVGMIDGDHRTSGEIFNDYENNKAMSDYSHAEGKGTIASRVGQHVEGVYNYQNDRAISIIGCGTALSRKNAVLVLDNTGDVYITNIGNYNGESIDDSKSLQTVIGDLDERLTETIVDVESLKESITEISEFEEALQTEINNRITEDNELTDLINSTKQEFNSKIDSFAMLWTEWKV